MEVASFESFARRLALAGLTMVITLAGLIYAGVIKAPGQQNAVPRGTSRARVATLPVPAPVASRSQVAAPAVLATSQAPAAGTFQEEPSPGGPAASGGREK